MVAEKEYMRLFDKRNDIQARMDEIRVSLTKEEYKALVKKIENPQLATLKKEGLNGDASIQFWGQSFIGDVAKTCTVADD
jgi:hypothetical protein